MLDSYRQGMSSQDELDLIKELHQSCERLKVNVDKLISETPQSEDIMCKPFKHFFIEAFFIFS